MPPVWISKSVARGSASPSPSTRGASPGNPRPSGLSATCSMRPSPACFQRAKSAGSRLSGSTSHAVPGAQVVERVARQPPVVGERATPRSRRLRPRRGIGVPSVLEALGEREHLGDVLRGPREDVGRQDVDERLVRVEAGLVGVGDLGWVVLSSRLGGDEHPVLAAVEALVAQVADVGDVLDVEHLDAVVEQGPADEVRQQEAAQVADVRPAVDGRAAGVDTDRSECAVGPRLEGLDRLDRARQGVPQVKGHGRLGERRAAGCCGRAAGQEGAAADRGRASPPPP